MTPHDERVEFERWRTLRCVWAVERGILLLAIVIASRLSQDEDSPRSVSRWIDWIPPLPDALGAAKTAISVLVALLPVLVYFAGRARDRRRNIVPSPWFTL